MVLDVTLGCVAVALFGAAVALAFSEPQPTAPRAAADLAAVLDVSGDGVDAADYARASDGVVPFETVDLDGDGLLSTYELDRILATQSPLVPQPNRLPQVL
ncbi:MAG: hypothetical protein GY913_06835 [Proteobacteria bacterium]|nr:hypothetical protein [Pseudomonadota bacterium]MCP4916622.1 hypothetical protein [Pseudomonadota bacterium]